MRIDKQEVCFGCPCFNPIGSYCNLTDVKNEQPCDTVLSNCPLPLASVPENHGDLIDRNELIDKLQQREYCKGCKNMGGILCTNCSKRNNDDRLIDYLFNEDVIIEAVE